MDLRLALKNRIALATQKDVIHGMFIENSLTLLAVQRGTEFAERTRERILARKKLVSFFRYPVVDLLKIIDTAVEGVPDCGATLEEYGANSVRIFFDSPVGKTMLMLASSNPHRMLFSAPAGFKASASFGERTYQKETETSGIMVTRGDLLGPSWQAGVFREALKAACNIDVKLQTTDVDEAALNYTTHVSW